MDNNKTRCSHPTVDDEKSPKRLKTDVSLDPSLLNSLANTPQPINMIFPNKSSSLPEIQPRLYQIRSEINNLFAQQRRILEDEAKSHKLANENLKLRLAESTKCCQEAKAAQVAAEAKLSQLKTEMEQKIAELLHQNSELEQRMLHQATQDTAKLNAATDRIIELKQEIKSAAVSQEELNLKATQLQEATMKNTKLESDKKCLWEEKQEFLPRAACVKELEEEVQSAKDGIATPRESVEKGRVPDEMTCSDGKMPNNAGRIGQQVVPEKCGLSPVLGEKQLKNSKEEIFQLQEFKVDQSRVEERKCQQREILRAKAEGMTAGNAKHDSKSSNNDSSVPVIIKTDKTACSNSSNGDTDEQNLRIPAGKFYVLASDRRFFDINWEPHYRRLGGDWFECNDCRKQKKSRQNMQDHIWTNHYGGQLKCPVCPNSTVIFCQRYGITRHMLKAHRQFIETDN